METDPKPGWVDVYLIEGERRVFKRRVDHPPGEDGMYALHSEMCRALAPSPASPLPLDRVVLVTYP